MTTKSHISIAFLFGICYLLFGFTVVVSAQTEVSVDLIWEADSYTPALYGGKALPTTDGSVRVFALPPTSLGTAANLTYTWKVNGQVLGSLSGKGRSFLSLAGSPFISDRLVTVTVTNGVDSAIGVVRIPYTKPQVLLYENSPLAGIQFEHAVPNRLTAEPNTDIELRAEPYYFATPRAQSLGYTWTIDGETSKASVGPSFIARSEATGTSTLSLAVTNPSYLLQRISKTLSIVLQ